MRTAMRICLLFTFTLAISYHLAGEQPGNNYRSLASTQEERKELSEEEAAEVIKVEVVSAKAEEKEPVITIDTSEEGKKTLEEVEAEMVEQAKEEAKKALDEANEMKIKAEKALAAAKKKEEEAKQVLLIVDEEYDCATCELEREVSTLMQQVRSLAQMNQNLMSELSISNPFTASGFMGYQDFYNVYGNYLYNSFAPNGIQQQPYNGLQRPDFNNTFSISQLSGYSTYPDSNSLGAYGRFSHEPVLTPDFNYGQFLGIGQEQNLFYGRSDSLRGFEFGSPTLTPPMAPQSAENGYNYMSA